MYLLFLELHLILPQILLALFAFNFPPQKLINLYYHHNFQSNLIQHFFYPQSAGIPSPCLSFSVLVPPTVSSLFRCQDDLFKHVNWYNLSVQNIPMASSRRIWNRSQGHDMGLLCRKYHVSPQLSPNHNLPATLWGCSSDRLSMLLSQGFCTCCFFCLEHSSPHYL